MLKKFQDSGKSRADLWAFAALVAVEYSMESNNMVCNGAMANIGNPDLHQVISVISPLCTFRSECVDKENIFPNSAITIK